MEKWIIAVSGGPDSMALLHKMMKSGYECIVAHVNYHMRAESEAEERLVRSFCDEHKVVFEMLDYRDEAGGNFQHKARNFRYEFFKSLVKSYGAQGVAVGHHKDDDIETYLIQKERNILSDVVGLESFAFVKEVKIWRPLLGHTKDDLIKYCTDNEIPYGIDKSNFETTYTRNRIRSAITDKDAIEKEMIVARTKDKQMKERIYRQIDFENPSLALNEFKKFHSQDLILREWIRRNGGTVHHHSLAFFSELSRQILQGKAFHDFDLIDLYCDHDTITLIKVKGFKYIFDAVPKRLEGICEFRKSGEVVEGLALRKEDFPIIVRSYEAGDSMEMRFGRKLVSRFFIDKKIPRYRRKNWLVIENAKGSVIFVVGMGCDVHHYSNNPETFVIELNLS